MLFVLAATITGIGYILRRMASFSWVKKHFPGKRRYLAGLGLVLVLSALMYVTIGLWSMAIAWIHLLVFWLLSDGIAVIVAHLQKKKRNYAVSGLAAVLVTLVYLGIGVFLTYDVARTEYTITSDSMETGETFRIAGFSDSHVGTVFSGKGLSKFVERMNAENPDVVVIVGDYVDDETSYEDMVEACRALGNLEARYGVYYVFGNHDAGYYGKEYRGYGKEELVEYLEKNHVTVLEDDVVSVKDQVYLCGRKDASQTDRKPVGDLIGSYVEKNCVIVLDHQPNDQQAEAQAKADLALSGHTHGGQLFPINRMGEWFGLNDMTYGIRKQDQTNFIVSSGIADWALKFRTGCRSEYFVVDICGRSDDKKKYADK